MLGAATKRRVQTHVKAEQEIDVPNSHEYDVSSSSESEASATMRLRGGRDAPSELDMDEDRDEDHDHDDDDDNNATPPPPSTNGRPRTNGAEYDVEFSPGAIVRVAVENFVSYEKAEFFPCPTLNMVIGPNGAGKSSVVCAICLGLGYPPHVMGRATTFSEFVKHGKDNGTVEIELQKLPQDKQNYVIKLKINRDSEHRDFWINGRQAPHKAVMKLCKELRIQIDNLCQFLPQDRVSEFGGMHPVELLNRTLQAVAPRDMLRQRVKLREMYDEQKTMQRALMSSAENLRSLKTRQEGLQADVKRLREREEIQKHIQDLKHVQAVLQYNQRKAMYEETRALKKRAVEDLKRLQDASGPALQDVASKTQYAAQVEKVLAARQRRARSADVAVEKAHEAMMNANTESQDARDNRTTEIQSLQKKKTEVGKIRSTIASLEGQYKNGRDTKFNAAEWNHKIRGHERRHAELLEQKQELVQKYDAVKLKGQEINKQIAPLQREIESLDSQEGQKLSRLQRLDKHAAEAYEWLRNNQDLFEKEVFGPPMLTCSVKDQRYSDQVQSLLQKDDFTCFTAQTIKDHRKLTNELYKERRLHVAIRTSLTDLNSFRPPIPQEELKSLGLDGYALDFMDGPEPVLAMLCAEKKLHVNGVALKDVTEQQFQRISEGEKINSWATGTTSYRITRRREYGPGATSTISKNLQPGKWWTDEPVDTSAKASLLKRLEQCQAERMELKQEFEGLKSAITELVEKADAVQQECETVKEQKNQLQREYNRWNSLPDKIQAQRNTLQRLQDDMEAIKKGVSVIDDSLDELSVKRAKLVLKHQQDLAALREATQAVVEAQTRHIEALSDVEALKLHNTAIVERLDREKQKVDDLSRRIVELKESAIEAQRVVTANWALESGEVDEDRRQFIIDLAREKTMDSVTTDIETEEAKLDLIHETDPGVLRDFENRAREIDKLEAACGVAQTKLQGLDERIQGLRDEWEPQLDEIFRTIKEGFSYNFEQIGCGGEVDLHKDEDFEKWAVHIKVKFRESETLQPLGPGRQSGGERALSTAFYLFSLQASAQGPFRVVDEINQGMDQRNERKVYRRMMDIACNEYKSQYFLITPKLLHDLYYDERVKVMCVASGEHMPDDGGKMDFGSCLATKRKLLAAASA